MLARTVMYRYHLLNQVQTCIWRAEKGHLSVKIAHIADVCWHTFQRELELKAVIANATAALHKNNERREVSEAGVAGCGCGVDRAWKLLLVYSLEIVPSHLWQLFYKNRESACSTNHDRD